MSEIPELRRYARRAAGAISAAGERRDTADELYEHALSLYEDHRSSGPSHDQALAAVLNELGHPEPLARDLERAHRQPVTPLAVTLLVLTTVAFLGLLIGFIVLLLSAGEHTGLILLGALVVVAVAAVVIAALGRRNS